MQSIDCQRCSGGVPEPPFGAASGARRSGPHSAQSWPMWAHLRRDCERPVMPVNRWLPSLLMAGDSAMSPMLILPVFTRNLRRSSGTAGEQTASQHPW
jgi:hypothetical protein